MFVSVSASFYLLGEPNRSKSKHFVSVNQERDPILTIGIYLGTFVGVLCVCADHSNIFGRNLLIYSKEVIMGCCIFNPSNILYVISIKIIRLIFQAFVRKRRVSFDFIHTENYPMYAQ